MSFYNKYIKKRDLTIAEACEECHYRDKEDNFCTKFQQSCHLAKNRCNWCDNETYDE